MPLRRDTWLQKSYGVKTASCRIYCTEVITVRMYIRMLIPRSRRWIEKPNLAVGHFDAMGASAHG